MHFLFTAFLYSTATIKMYQKHKILNCIFQNIKFSLGKLRLFAVCAFCKQNVRQSFFFADTLAFEENEHLVYFYRLK
jgi:hypothetical protein